MTSSSFTKAVGVIAELNVIVGVQDQADHFRQEFVTPDGQTQRTLFPVALQDVDPTRRSPLIPLGAQRLDDGINLFQRYGINGFLIDAFCRGTCVLGLSVSGQVEMLVEQLSIDTRQRQSSFASFTEKSQVRSGGLHFACLSVYGLPDTFPVHRDQRCTLAYLRRLPLHWFGQLLWGFRRLAPRGV